MSIIASKGNSANVTFTNPQEIIISHTDDSIKIGDGTDLLAINADGSINANVAVDHTQDSIKIGDGVDTLAINSDGSINVNANVSTSIPKMASRSDIASSSVIYEGEAAPGSAGTSAVWCISRTTISGSNFVTEYAGGSAAYSNIWDNRASLSYS